MFRVLGFIIRYLPIILTAVKAVEELTDANTTGEEKKLLVLKAVSDVLASFGIVISDTYLDVISKAVDTVVSILNALGIFRHADDESADEEAVPAPVASEEVRRRVEEIAVSDERFAQFLKDTAHLE